jgi:hypothetical protein
LNAEFYFPQVSMMPDLGFQNRGIKTKMLSTYNDDLFISGFYSRIECKPGSAGFWLIIALRVSVGVVMIQLPEWISTKKTIINNLSNF